MKNILSRLEQAEQKANNKNILPGDICQCPEAPILIFEPTQAENTADEYIKELYNLEYQKKIDSVTARKGDICPVCKKAVSPGKRYLPCFLYIPETSI